MFSYSLWRSLELPARIKIANDLGIKKIGPTHVRDNVVESDGYVIGDVEKALNVDALQAYLQTDKIDLATLFNMLVKNARGEEVKPVVEAVIEPVKEEIKEEVKETVKKVRKTKKNAKA